MANSNRFNPVIDGFKECSKCKISKELTTGYYFNSAIGYYQGKCKECVQEERRLNHPILSGRREDSVYIRQKKCSNCGIDKDINSDNFGRAAGRFSKVCKECSLKRTLAKKEEKRQIGYLKDDEKRVCITCKEEKTIKDFSFSKATGYYSSYCKICDVQRKRDRFNNLSDEDKEKTRKFRRDWHKNNKPASLYTVYRQFDFQRKLENNLTVEYIKEKLQQPCTYCSFPSTGLDRKDNSIGHTEDNCIPCCWECNTARMNNFSHEDMFELGAAIKRIKERKLSMVDNINKLIPF